MQSRKEYDKQYYLKCKEKKLLYMKNWYEKNKHLKDKDAIKVYQKEHYLKNKEYNKFKAKIRYETRF